MLTWVRAGPSMEGLTQQLERCLSLAHLPLLHKDFLQAANYLYHLLNRAISCITFWDVWNYPSPTRDSQLYLRGVVTVQFSGMWCWLAVRKEQLLKCSVPSCSDVPLSLLYKAQHWEQQLCHTGVTVEKEFLAVHGFHSAFVTSGTNCTSSPGSKCSKWQKQFSLCL